MDARQLTRPLAALLAVVPSARPPHPARPPSSASCHAVEGRIDARARRLGVDVHGFKVSGDGSMQGGLEGELRLVVRREGRHGPETELSIRLTAATASGPVRMDGTALAARERETDPLHRVRGWLDVTDADGATGRMTVEGTADTQARRIAIRYAGELCAVGHDEAAR